jgi:hypothetical protein
MSEMIVTILRPVVKIRRGPGTGAGIIKAAKIGEQYRCLQVIDLKGREQWARIVLPSDETQNAYICARMASGTPLCEVSVASAPGNTDDYKRGYRDGVEHVLAWVSAERAKLGD